jgi:type II secretion system protein G
VQDNTRDGERGFTLIELMIVVGIIAILAGILIPNFVNARAQAQTAACESNLRQIATALELYYADNQEYPEAGGFTDVTPALLSANGVAYLNSIPKDPAALDQTRNYQVKTTPQSGTSPASYTIVCPGTHVGSTLAKLNTTGGTICGTACTDTHLQYVAGAGLAAAP